MSSMCAFRSVLASVVILFLLRAVPAYPSDGSVNVTALAIDPKTPTTLYAGTCEGGLFKSMDGGASWTATGLSNIYISALVIDPRTPATLYAGATPHDCTGAGVVGAQGPDVYKSTDGGATWTASALAGVEVTTLAIDPKDPTRLYAGSAWNGVFNSADGGATWSGSGGLFSISTLAIDPVAPSTVYAATGFVGDEGFTWDGGLFKSTDGGASWNATALATGSFGALAIDPRTDRDALTPPTVYVGGYDLTSKGLFKSMDGGATWQVASLPDLIGALAIDRQTPTTLYAGSASGALKSTDGGATWSAVNKGLRDVIVAYGWGPNVSALAIDPMTPNTVYAGTVIGVFKSVDGGANWTPTGLFQHSLLVSLTVNPLGAFYGASSTGTVNLVAPAPPGGITVALASSNPSVATVPASVTVPAGEASASFVISTTPDPWATWPVNISATLDGVTRGTNLMVSATTLSSFFLSPTSVAGGTPSTGTVGLSAAAPAGGATIPLSSSNPTVASVPASVSIPAGAMWANFAISTSSLSGSASVTVSAANYWATLTVTPTPASVLSSLSLNPASVSSGSASTGTVTLSVPAPAGGAAVSLANSAPSVASIPAAVTVGAGALTANFSVTTVACTSGPATVSGTYGGMTKSAELNVMSNADSVAIDQATYFAGKRELRVNARSSAGNSTLRVYVTSSGALIGTMLNLGAGNYSGAFAWPVNPANITVRSSSCGTASAVVTKK